MHPLNYMHPGAHYYCFRNHCPVSKIKKKSEISDFEKSPNNKKVLNMLTAHTLCSLEQLLA